MRKQFDNYELYWRLTHFDKRLSFVEEIAGIGYVEMDIKKRKIFVSSEIGKLLGYNVKVPAFLRLKDITMENEYHSFIKKINQLYHYKKPVQGNIWLYSRMGTLKYFKWHAAYFTIERQEIIAGTMQDLTELEALNQKYKKAQQEAEKSSREKSVFLAQASHDLRQPMMALCLYVDLFSTDGLTHKQYDIWKKIEQSAVNLRSLLNNFLDLSKLEYNAVQVCPKEVNIGLLMSALGQEFSDLSEFHNLEFVFTICNCSIITDQVMLERILRNLLSNAFKFARRKVGMYCHETADKVVISVQDDGQGMKQDEIKLIFDEFYRGQNARDHKIDGAGLGLAIVKKLAKLLQAEIEVDSVIKKGSTFKIVLPKRI